jgi:hypothetical protein
MNSVSSTLALAQHQLKEYEQCVKTLEEISIVVIGLFGRVPPGIFEEELFRTDPEKLLLRLFAAIDLHTPDRAAVMETLRTKVLRFDYPQELDTMLDLISIIKENVADCDEQMRADGWSVLKDAGATNDVGCRLILNNCRYLKLLIGGRPMLTGKKKVVKMHGRIGMAILCGAVGEHASNFLTVAEGALQLDGKRKKRDVHCGCNAYVNAPGYLYRLYVLNDPNDLSDEHRKMFTDKNMKWFVAGNCYNNEQIPAKEATGSAAAAAVNNSDDNDSEGYESDENEELESDAVFPREGSAVRRDRSLVVEGTDSDTTDSDSD